MLGSRVQASDDPPYAAMAESGLLHLTWNQAYGYPVPRVQIPLAAPLLILIKIYDIIII